MAGEVLSAAAFHSRAVLFRLALTTMREEPETPGRIFCQARRGVEAPAICMMPASSMASRRAASKLRQ